MTTQMVVLEITAQIHLKFVVIREVINIQDQEDPADEYDEDQLDDSDEQKH